MKRRAAVILALAIGLAGCSSPESSRTYTPTAANELQSVVLEISEAASVDDFAAAAGSLDQLEAAAVAAFARGEISNARYDAIMVAIRLVRSDLDTAIAQEVEETRDPTPTPEPAEADPGTSGDTGGTGNGRGNPGEPGPPDDRGKPNG